MKAGSGGKASTGTLIMDAVPLRSPPSELVALQKSN